MNTKLINIKLWQVGLNLNFNQHGVILYEWFSTNLINGGKQLKTAPNLTANSCGFSEGQQLWWCNKHLSDIFRIFGSALIQNWESDDTSEWPSQPVIAFTLHHVNKDCHMGANSTIHTIEVHSNAERVPIRARENRWTKLSNHSSSDGILTAL